MEANCDWLKNCVEITLIGQNNNFDTFSTFLGLVNRGDSFRRRHNRSNSLFPSSSGVLADQDQNETTTHVIEEPATTMPDTCVITYNVSVIGATGVGKTSLISQFMTSECINPYDRDRGEFYFWLLSSHFLKTKMWGEYNQPFKRNQVARMSIKHSETNKEILYHTTDTDNVQGVDVSSSIYCCAFVHPFDQYGPRNIKKEHHITLQANVVDFVFVACGKFLCFCVNKDSCWLLCDNGTTIHRL